MRVPLQAWYDEWLAAHKDTNLIYVDRNHENRPYLQQVHFVRDVLGHMLWADKLYDDVPREPPPRTTSLETAWIIGEHTSKSVRLPVYSLERPDKGLRFVLRDNKYNWKLSVISETPIVNPDGIFDYLFYTSPPREPAYTGNVLASVYFEGFPSDLIFGYYSQNPCRWSAEISGERGVWMTVMLVLKQLGVCTLMRQTTKEEHREALDARDEARKRREAREAAAKAAQ